MRVEFYKTVKFALRISLSGICILDFFPSVPFSFSLPVMGHGQPAQAQPVQQPTAPAWITYQRRGRRPSG